MLKKKFFIVWLVSLVLATIYFTLLNQHSYTTEAHMQQAISMLINTSSLSKNATKTNAITVKELTGRDKSTFTCPRYPLHPLLPACDLQDCSLPYVTIGSGGRLGNNVCQYAVLLYVRRVFGVRVAMQVNMKTRLEKVFSNLTMSLIDKKCFPKTNSKVLINQFMNKTMHAYNTLLVDHDLQTPKTKVTLHPVFDTTDINNRLNKTDISHRFNKTDVNHRLLITNSVQIDKNPALYDIMIYLRQEMRQALRFRPEVTLQAQQRVKEVLQGMGFARENVAVVTCHVRRTDYKKWMKKNFNSGYLTENYYKNAFAYFRKRIHNSVFLLISDDPQWCKKKLGAEDVAIAGNGNQEYPAVDLALLSLGDHSIISHGTFGFSGALLGTGTVVYPTQYGPMATSQELLYRCAQDESFVPIPENSST